MSEVPQCAKKNQKKQKTKNNQQISQCQDCRDFVKSNFIYSYITLLGNSGMLSFQSTP